MKLASCFKYFKAVPTNPRWSWSAREQNCQTVVIVLWKDGFDYRCSPAVYSDFDDEGPPAWAARPGSRDRRGWMSLPGNKERLENMKWARDKLGGVFRVVVATARDVQAEPREIADCHIVEWRMRLTALNEETGQFKAEMVTDDTKGL